MTWVTPDDSPAVVMDAGCLSLSVGLHGPPRRLQAAAGPPDGVRISCRQRSLYELVARLGGIDPSSDQQAARVLTGSAESLGSGRPSGSSSCAPPGKTTSSHRPPPPNQP